MTPERIAELFERLRDPEEGVNSFIYDALLSQMLGRSLEAALPLLERAHDIMAAEPMKRFLLPGGETTRTAMALECPEGPHGGIWRKAFMFEGAGQTVLTVLEVSGEPNPSFEASMDAILAKRGIAREQRKHEPGPVRGVKVYAPRGRDEITEVLRDDSRDAWRSDKILETDATLPPFGERAEWREFRRNVLSGAGLTLWPSYFRDLSALLDTLGLRQEMEANSVEIAGRNWADAGEGQTKMDDYGAARAFGAEAALEDGHLPGENCLAALSALDRLAAESAMATLHPQMLKLAEHLPIVMDERGHFDCNDGRNEVAYSDRGGSCRLDMADQNNRYEVTVLPDEVQVLGKRTNRGLRETGGSPCLDLRFARRTDGGWAMTGAIGQSSDAIRSWNSFKGGVMTLSCCAAEEVKDRAESSPSGPTA